MIKAHPSKKNSHFMTILYKRNWRYEKKLYRKAKKLYKHHHRESVFVIGEINTVKSFGDQSRIVQVKWSCRWSSCPLQWAPFQCRGLAPKRFGGAFLIASHIHVVFQVYWLRIVYLRFQTVKHVFCHNLSIFSPSQGLSHRHPLLPAYSPDLRQTGSEFAQALDQHQA